MEVHFDGACERTGRGSIAGFGYTITGPGLDHEGYGLAVSAFDRHATNNVAEYAGAVRALEWLTGRGYRGGVTVRGDSQLVIRQMTGEYRVRAEHLRAFHDRLRQLSAGFHRVDFVWIPRDQNQRADQLSKKAVLEAQYPRRPPTT